MKLLLHLALFTSLSRAACVWLRTTGDQTGEAWCVDDNTGEEGYFHYTLAHRKHNKFSSVKLHETINRLYRQHQRRLIVDEMRAESHNWTVLAAELFNSGMDVYDSLRDAFDNRLRNLRADYDTTIPLSTCMNRHNEDCLLRVDDNVMLMSERQLAALDQISTAACSKYRMHLKTDTRVDDTIQRGCCRCEVGEDHIAEGRPGFIIFRKEELSLSPLDGGDADQAIDSEGHDEL